MSMFCEALLYFLVALPAVAQSPAFARITIKPARSADSRARVQVLPNGDLIASAVPVGMLLSYAYDLPVNPSQRLSPLPDWTREKYDIEAKAAANTLSLGPQDSGARSRVRQMVRGLLTDRFRLVMRVENKTMSVYALTVASEDRSSGARPSPRRTAPSLLLSATRTLAITLLVASAIP